MIRSEMLKALAALTLLAAGCGSSTCKSSSCAPHDVNAANCNVAAMLVRCTANGVTSESLSDAADACNVPGATCENVCAENEYAASCGGLPEQLADGGTFEPPVDPPASNCRSVGVTPGGTERYCCPCS